MNVLFLTVINISTINERGIYQDLLREFIKNNHSVYIVSPSEKRYSEKTRIIEDSKCKILKVKTGNIQKTNVIEKGISTLLIEPQFISAIKKYYTAVKFDFVIYATPPITFVKAIKYIKKKYNAKNYLLLKDIFPQNAVDLQMFSKKGLIYKYFRSKEKKLYKLSDFIGCMSQGNADYVLKHNDYIEKSKVHVSPNSIEPSEISIDEAVKNELRKKYDIPLETKVLLYGGNLGKPQDIPFIIECLKKNQNKKDIYFVICGTGTDYYKLGIYVKENNPANIKLINGLSKSDYDELTAACDIGLIFLDKRFTIPNFPSRILSYMENNMPVIACTDVNTDIGKVIVSGDFGWWCASDNAGKFTDIVDNISEEDIRIKGKNARNYLEENYTTKKSYDVIKQKLGI